MTFFNFADYNNDVMASGQRDPRKDDPERYRQVQDRLARKLWTKNHQTTHTATPSGHDRVKKDSM